MAIGDKKPVVMEGDIGELVPPNLHAAQHAADGSDPITPDMINAVNKAGDTMTGALKVEISGVQNIHSVNPNADVAFVQYYNPTDKRAANIGWNDNQLYFQPTRDLVAWAKYNILHTGNKPSGSYTGNGDATARTIDTGGIGNVCIINGGTGGSVIVSNAGGIIVTTQGTMLGLKYSEARFANGVLTIATASMYINHSGSTFTYQVL